MYVQALTDLEQMRQAPGMAMAATGGTLLSRVESLLMAPIFGFFDPNDATNEVEKGERIIVPAGGVDLLEGGRGNLSIAGKGLVLR